MCSTASVLKKSTVQQYLLCIWVNKPDFEWTATNMHNVNTYFFIPWHFNICLNQWVNWAEWCKICGVLNVRNVIISCRYFSREEAYVSLHGYHLRKTDPLQTPCHVWPVEQHRMTGLKARAHLASFSHLLSISSCQPSGGLSCQALK